MDDDGQRHHRSYDARRRVKIASTQARLDKLSQRVLNLEKLPKTVQGALNALHDEIRFVRRRLAQFQPEREWCKKCHALIRPGSTSCKSCGAIFGPQIDPQAGLPR